MVYWSVKPGNAIRVMEPDTVSAMASCISFMTAVTASQYVEHRIAGIDMCRARSSGVQEIRNHSKSCGRSTTIRHCESANGITMSHSSSRYRITYLGPMIDECTRLLLRHSCGMCCNRMESPLVKWRRDQNSSLLVRNYYRRTRHLLFESKMS